MLSQKMKQVNAEPPLWAISVVLVLLVYRAFIKPSQDDGAARCHRDVLILTLDRTKFLLHTLHPTKAAL